MPRPVHYVSIIHIITGLSVSVYSWISR